MTSNTPDTWSQGYGTSATPSETPLSPSRYSHSSDSYSPYSGSNGSGSGMRRIIVSPSGSPEDLRDSYTDDNSIDEVDAALNNLENDLNDTEHALSEWSSSNRAPSYTTGSFTGSYSGTYTGSTSYINLPNIASRSPSMAAVGLGARLSRITERSDESRPSSGAFTARDAPRPTSTTGLRRSALLSGVTSGHGRSSTEPTGDPTLPRPGRATELIAVFETQGPAGAHARAASAPGARPTSPFYAPSQTASTMQTTTGYTHGTSTFGFHSRSSSPSKSRNGSTLSYTDTRPTMSSLMSPPPPPPKSEEFKSRTATVPAASQSRTATASQLSPSTQTTSALTNTVSPSQTASGSRTFTRSETASFTTSAVNTSTHLSSLRRPQTTPRSPLASVRNIVTLWKERTPAGGQSSSGGKISTSATASSTPPQDPEGLVGVRRRVQRAGERLRGTGLSAGEQPGQVRRSGDAARSGDLPPGFDIGELSQYAQSNEAPLHIGLLWYLNVHAPPPYRWQRCQALLYPHMLLLSWLAPGGGRGIVALDLLNCTSVQSTPSPTHPSARDDVGTVAARLQSSERDGQPLMDMLVPFQMLYADGIERVAAESLLERQRWVNRIWDAVNRPISATNTSDVPRSPTGSIRTILSIDSRTSSTSTGSRSTVYVPPMNTLTDIPDFQSDFSSNSRSTSVNLGLARRVSLVSSHHKHTVDDTVIQNQEYIYPGDPRHIPPSRGNSLRRTGSMSDLDQEFARALKAKRSGLVASPVTISSGPSLGQDLFVTPPPSIAKGSDRSRSEHSLSQSDEAFFSAGVANSSSGVRSNVSSTYYSQTGDDQTVTALLSDETLRGLSSSGGTLTQMTSTLSYRGSDLNSYSQDQNSSGVSSLSRAREVRRRLNRVSSRTMSTPLTDASSDKENSLSGSGSYTYSGTPGTQSYGLSGTYTPGSGDLTTLSGSYTPRSGEYSPASGSYTPGSGSYTESQSHTPGSGSYSGSRSYASGGSYTPGSGSYTPSGGDTSNGIGTPSSNGVSAVRASSSSEGEASLTPGTETGYDICPSSDLSGLTPATSSEEYSSSPVPSSPIYVAIRPVPVVGVEPEKVIHPRVISSRESIASFDTCPTIPSESDYATADELSDYSTAKSRPSKAASTEYLTASELVPSSVISLQESIQRSSYAISLKSESEGKESVMVKPSPVPTIRSLASSVGRYSVQPQDIPLPGSTSPPERSLSITPSLRSVSPTPSVPPSQVPSIIEDSQSPLSSYDLPQLPQSPAGDFASESDEELLGSIRTRPSPSSDGTRSLAPESEPERSIKTRSPPHSDGPSLSLVQESEPELEPATISPQTQRSAVFSSPTEWSVPFSELPHTSPAPSTPIPPSLISWAGDNETDRSYDSSQLQPSPSLMSVTMPEAADLSYGTSFLRPGGSVVSSVNKILTLPPSPSILTPARTPLPRGVSQDIGMQPLVHPIPHSAEVSSSSLTPSTVTMSSSSSWFSSSLSSSPPPSPSLSLSDSRSLLPVVTERPGEQVAVTPPRTPRTISTLLETPRARSLTPTPILSTRTHTVTPEGSVIISVSTPYGSGGTQQHSLGSSVESLPLPPTPPDFIRELDRLADKLRQYDETRCHESKDIADNLQALRDELNDLSDFLRRTPPPNVVRVIEERSPIIPPAPAPRVMESRSIGGSTEIGYLGPRELPDSVSVHLSRTSSITSVGSFLSSHHSDDLSLYGYGSSVMAPISDMASETDDGYETSFVSSSEVISSGSAPTLPLPPPVSPVIVRPPRMTTTAVQVPSQEIRSYTEVSSAPTVRSPIDLTVPLNTIYEQINKITEGQADTLRRLESLRGREYPEIPAIHDKINRVEDLIRNLVQRFENQPVVVPIPIHPPPPHVMSDSRPQSRVATIHDPAEHERASLTDSDESSLIRRIETDLSTPGPIQPTAPSFAEQLQEILASTRAVPPAVGRPPPLDRFRYEPLEGGARPRSASPASLGSILQPRMSVPSMTEGLRDILENIGELGGRSGPPPEVPPAGTGEDLGTTLPPSTRTAEDEWNERMRKMRERLAKIPPPLPVLPPPQQERPGSAPGWYRTAVEQPQHQLPDAQTQPGRTQPVITQPSPVQSGPAHAPSHTGPTYVQIPPIFEQLMSFVRESHLAQTATYQQQQDLARYMRELNEWLARDVHDRHEELTSVTARLDNLTHLLLQGRHGESTDGESDDGVAAQRPVQRMTGPAMPVPDPFVHPQRLTPAPVIPMQGVIPPVIPHTQRLDHSPEPPFTPVVPPQPTQPMPMQPYPPNMTTVIPPPPIISAPYPTSTTMRPHHSPSSHRSHSPHYPFIPPHPEQGSDLVQRPTSSDSSSVTSTDSADSVGTRHTRREGRDGRGSRTPSHRHSTRSSTPIRRYPPRVPTHLTYEEEGRSTESSRTPSPVPIQIITPSVGTSGGSQQIQHAIPSQPPPVQVVVPPSTAPVAGTSERPEFQSPSPQPLHQPQPPTNIIIQTPQPSFGLPHPPPPPSQPVTAVIQPSEPSSPSGSSGSSMPPSRHSSRRTPRRGDSSPRPRRTPSNRTYTTHQSRSPVSGQPFYAISGPPAQPIMPFPQPVHQMGPPPTVIIRSESQTTSTPSRRQSSPGRTSYRPSVSRPGTSRPASPSPSPSPGAGPAPVVVVPPAPSTIPMVPPPTLVPIPATDRGHSPPLHIISRSDRSRHGSLSPRGSGRRHHHERTRSGSSSPHGSRRPVRIRGDSRSHSPPRSRRPPYERTRSDSRSPRRSHYERTGRDSRSPRRSRHHYERSRSDSRSPRRSQRPRHERPRSDSRSPRRSRRHLDDRTRSGSYSPRGSRYPHYDRYSRSPPISYPPDYAYERRGSRGRPVHDEYERRWRRPPRVGRSYSDSRSPSSHPSPSYSPPITGYSPSTTRRPSSSHARSSRPYSHRHPDDEIRPSEGDRGSRPSSTRHGQPSLSYDGIETPVRPTPPYGIGESRPYDDGGGPAPVRLTQTRGESLPYDDGTRTSSTRPDHQRPGSPYDDGGRQSRPESRPYDDGMQTPRTSATRPDSERVGGPYDDAGRISRRSSVQFTPPSTVEGPEPISPVQVGPRSEIESPRSALPSEGPPQRSSDRVEPGEESPSPLPRPGPRDQRDSRSPTPTRSPQPRYLPPPSERGWGEPITIVVPRRDRSPTIVSLGPEGEYPEGRDQTSARPTSQRSIADTEPFDTQPSLYTPSRRPSAHQPSRARTEASTTPAQDIAPGSRAREGTDDGESIVHEPASPSTTRFPESIPPRRPSTRITSDLGSSYRGEPSVGEPSRPPSIAPSQPSQFASRRPSEATVPGSIRSITSRRASPLDLRQEEEQERQLERLNEVESRLEDVETSLREAEDRRDLAFRQNEDDRHRIFLENQGRRDQEARDHAERLLEAIDSRLASLVPVQPPPPPPAPPSEVVSEEPEAIIGDTQSMIDSVRTASQEAAMQYSRDIQDIIKAEREEFAREREAAAAEREQLLAESEAERGRLAEEREARIIDLEQQLASVKRELEDEKQRRITEEADTQERQRQELEERDEVLRNQLGDITNLIHDQRQVCEAKKDLMQAQWEEKQRRRLDKDAKWIELRDMVLKLHDDMENDRIKLEDYRRLDESKPGYDQLVEELRRQNAEQRELLANLSESWRADCARHHEETINAVRQTAQEQVPFNVQGYLDEFSKALATEVRMLLGEVGKLREERRTLQHEIGFLLTMKSKYGPGGEFEPEWKPGMPPDGPGDGPPPEQPPPEQQPPQQVRPGWRPVQRRKKKKEAAPPPPSGMVVDPRHQIQSWATWQPDPSHVPTPPSVEPTLLVPNRGSPGLFGPRTPRSSYYGN